MTMVVVRIPVINIQFKKKKNIRRVVAVAAGGNCQLLEMAEIHEPPRPLSDDSKKKCRQKVRVAVPSRPSPRLKEQKLSKTLRTSNFCVLSLPATTTTTSRVARAICHLFESMNGPCSGLPPGHTLPPQEKRRRSNDLLFYSKQLRTRLCCSVSTTSSLLFGTVQLRAEREHERRRRRRSRG